MGLFRKRPKYPDVDIMGRPFGTIDEVEAEVNEKTATKQTELDQVEQRLTAADLPPAERADLEGKRKDLRTFFWLLSGGDRRGEPPPE